ncbi:carbamoyltransferase HypF [Caproicibacterium lactatifermentans]|uniref:Carbamoyltransferase n=1 Tax=Caproicibacterium lactatifermentans TaxID=2666138 RepID=A0A859DW45_9FIRM|nr:carbamoyltransferase HypF [Caproicibacterium lactatifermentans]QKN24513.1 carbamoyltransferase HypF [Caproicibacterium lactatifermentans]
MKQKAEILSQRIRVFGVVQGVGFRPFVSRTARRVGITGSVTNKGSFVEIQAHGTKEALQAFLRCLRQDAPERSDILKIEVTASSALPESSFEIISSAKESSDIFVPPDIAVCKTCSKELFDKHNRRYLHPFINCTACGPRLTILDIMPYDRERTSMGKFPMCKKCEQEYTHPQTRRYDAQPVCCNDCGPQVYLMGRPERGADAIIQTRRAIMDGKIAAVKGIGGFHLCCDAKNETAVRRLRQLKHRPAKPFAVMFRDLSAAKENCCISPKQADILDGCQKPILLLDRKPESTLTKQTAPGNPRIGSMLPYAPLQLLLFTYPDGVAMTDSLIMTSGNVSGAPICKCDADAAAELSGFCDVILSHNRDILTRADDSVMDFLEDKPYMIRRSRGYAPLPFLLSAPLHGQVLGIGGELKNTFCIGKNSLFYPSAYVGDMADIRTVEALKESISRMETLLEASPQVVACDLHPKYNTVRMAEEMGLPVMRVQHHFAHIVSCLAENDCSDEVIGVSFDGTGYGTDGTIWGGEFLRASYGGFTRLGCIQPFLQVGGDASAREGWRIAVSMLHHLFPEDTPRRIQALGLCSAQQAQVVMRMADQNLNSVPSTSTGRLFDAVSAILGIRTSSTFEGEASCALEFSAEAYQKQHLRLSADSFSYSEPLLRSTQKGFVLCTDRLVGWLTQQRLAGEDTGKLAYAFHILLADMVCQGCRKIRQDTELSICALSGGVFQNRLLTGLCATRLRDAGFRVLLHSMVPPNDGGLALGQATAAMYLLNKERNDK